MIDITDKIIIRKYFLINPSLFEWIIDGSISGIKFGAKSEWGKFVTVRFVGDNVRSRLWLSREVLCVCRYVTELSPKLEKTIS